MKADSIIDAVEGVTKKWAKQRRAEKREAAARGRRRQVMVYARPLSIREAAFDAMEAAYRKASADGAYRRAVGADYLREHSAELIESARHHSSEAPIPPELRRELIRRIKRSPAISWDLVVRDLARK